MAFVLITIGIISTAVIIFGIVLPGIRGDPLFFQVQTPLDQVVQISPEGEPVIQVGLVSVNRAVQFTLEDDLAGSGISSAIVQVWQGGALVQNLTTDSNGQVTSGRIFKSGDKYDVLTYTASLPTSDRNASKWRSWEVPFMGPSDAQAQANNPVTLFMKQAALVTMVVVDTTTFAQHADAGWWNGSSCSAPCGAQQPGVDVSTMQVQLSVTTDNRGYECTFSPIDNQNECPYVQIKVLGTDFELIGVSNCDRSVERGSAFYCFKKVDPALLTREVQGGITVVSGSTSVEVQIDLSGYAAATGDFDIDLWGNADPEVFISARRADLGPNAIRINAGSTTIDLDIDND